MARLHRNIPLEGVALRVARVSRCFIGRGLQDAEAPRSLSTALSITLILPPSFKREFVPALSQFKLRSRIQNTALLCAWGRGQPGTAKIIFNPSVSRFADLFARKWFNFSVDLARNSVVYPECK